MDVPSLQAADHVFRYRSDVLVLEPLQIVDVVDDDPHPLPCARLRDGFQQLFELPDILFNIFLLLFFFIFAPQTEVVDVQLPAVFVAFFSHLGEDLLDGGRLARSWNAHQDVIVFLILLPKERLHLLLHGGVRDEVGRHFEVLLSVLLPQIFLLTPFFTLLIKEVYK